MDTSDFFRVVSGGREVCLTTHGGEALNILHPSLQRGLDQSSLVLKGPLVKKTNSFLFTLLLQKKMHFGNFASRDTGRGAWPCWRYSETLVTIGQSRKVCCNSDRILNSPHGQAPEGFISNEFLSGPGSYVRSRCSKAFDRHSVPSQPVTGITTAIPLPLRNGEDQPWDQSQD